MMFQKLGYILKLIAYYSLTGISSFFVIYKILHLNQWPPRDMANKSLEMVKVIMQMSVVHLLIKQDFPESPLCARHSGGNGNGKGLLCNLK